MGDDTNNGIYTIKMPNEATLRELINILLKGGNGNDWPIPQTSEIGWVIYSNIGKIAVVSHDLKKIEFTDSDGDTRLNVLGIEWVFGEREGENPEISLIARHFLD
jgi:hypothetical protein